MFRALKRKSGEAGKAAEGRRSLRLLVAGVEVVEHGIAVRRCLVM